MISVCRDFGFISRRTFRSQVRFTDDVEEEEEETGRRAIDGLSMSAVSIPNIRTKNKKSRKLVFLSPSRYEIVSHR
jgi:hypothetical protein